MTVEKLGREDRLHLACRLARVFAREPRPGTAAREFLTMLGQWKASAYVADEIPAWRAAAFVLQVMDAGNTDANGEPLARVDIEAALKVAEEGALKP